VAYLGLDIGATNAKAVLLSDGGDGIADVSVPTLPGGDGVVKSALVATAELFATTGLTASDLVSIGIGVPGVVDSAAGTVAHAVNLGITADRYPLAARLSAELGAPAVLANDLDIAALGAYHLYGSDVNDLAFISLGTGLAAGFIINGSLYAGHGSVGEIGHIPVVENGIPCFCGQRGCLERYCSGSALDKLWPALPGVPAPRALFEAAAAGNSEAVALVNQYCYHLAIAIRNLILTTGPQLVVIGGGVVRLGAPLLNGVKAALTELAAPSEFLQSLNMADRVILADTDTPVAAIGAAIMGRDFVTDLNKSQNENVLNQLVNS